MKLLSDFGSWVERMFDKHMLVRRVLVAWAGLEVHWLLAAYRANIGKVDGPDATIIVAGIGLIGTVLGAGYLWVRQKNEQ